MVVGRISNMDDSELVPPSRLSMTDEELEAAVELAKSQPDGLIAAIVLLEEQTQLRAQDDANFADFAAKNQHREHTNAAPEPAPEAPVVEAVIEPTIDNAAVEPSVVKAEPDVDYLDAPEEAEATPVAEPFEPAAAILHDSEFDAILESALEDDGDELFSDTDFSVTGTLAQIVDQVNDDFSKPQEELAPEVDDLAESVANAPSPVPASSFDSDFEEAATKSSDASSESKSAQKYRLVRVSEVLLVGLLVSV
jgi:hypothetical protein